MSLVNFKQGTLANYKVLGTKDANTLYFVTDQGLLYLGSKLIAATEVAQKVNYKFNEIEAGEYEFSTVESLPVANSGVVGNKYYVSTEEKYYECVAENVAGTYTITYIDGTNSVQKIDVATSAQISTLITNAINALDTQSDVVVASKSGDVVTLTKAVKEVDGIISAVTGENATIALGTAAVKDYQTEAIPTTGEVTSTDLVNAAQVAAYVAAKMTGVVGAMVYQGTISKSGNALVVDGAATQPTSADKGYVYVASANFTLDSATDLIISGKTIPAGSYEAGDMFIYNGNAWNVVSGENQVTNSQATITPGASDYTTIATVDGTTITAKVAGLADVVDEGTGNVVTDVTASGNTITISRANVIASIDGESSISGTGDYVAVHATVDSGDATNIDLTSEVKTQTLASAASNADGLATAYDVKQNAAANCVLTSYSTVTGGTVATSDTINSAINKLETVLVWGSF